MFGFLGAFTKLRKVTITFIMSVPLFVSLSVRLPAWNNSAPTRRIFMTFILSIFRKYAQKIQVSLKSDKENRYFTWRPIHMFHHI